MKCNVVQQCNNRNERNKAEEQLQWNELQLSSAGKRNERNKVEEELQ